MLKQLERKLGRFALPHLTWILIGGQVMFFMGMQANPELYSQMVLIPGLVLKGEVWRLFVFMFIPESMSLIWFAIGMYVLHLMGTALENQWGDFRFNLYILIGMLGTIGAAFIFPGQPATNVYLMTSVFLAFAYLFPDFEFLLFFILPVKVKYLGYLTAALYGFIFITGDLATKAMISAALLNFSLFFSRDIYQRAKNGRRTMERKVQAIKEANTPFHICSVCKRTDKTDPQLHFRYLPGSGEPVCYCEDHMPG